MSAKRSNFDVSCNSAAMLLCSKIVSPHGDCIAHQPRISLKKMCDMSHLGILGVREDNVLPLKVGQMKLIPLGDDYTLVVRRLR